MGTLAFNSSTACDELQLLHKANAMFRLLDPMILHLLLVIGKLT
jgi:hypothetical protein